MGAFSRKEVEAILFDKKRCQIERYGFRNNDTQRGTNSGGWLDIEKCWKYQ